MLPLGEKSFEISGGPVMDRLKIEWDRIPKKTPDQALKAMEQKRYSGFFRGLFSVDPVGQISLEFSANFDVEDWKMTLED